MLEISGIGAATAFLAGLISFLSPCVLPLVPGYVAYIAGEFLQTAEQPALAQKRSATVMLSAFFVLGFSTVFIALGASATALGQLLLAYRYEAGIVSGVIIILFGLFMIGLLMPAQLQRDIRFNLNIPGGRPVAAYVLGLTFAFGWTPCIGPVLGAILTVSASSAGTASGLSLLSIYSLGLGLPFLIAAAFTGAFAGWIKRVRRTGRVLQVGAGVALVIMGAAMITGDLPILSIWLLETFPSLGLIG